MDDSWMLIYKAPMEYYLKVCNHITTISAVVLAGFVVKEYINRDKVKDSEQKPWSIIGGKVLMAETDYVYFAIAFFAFNFVLRVMVYRYPLRIYMKGNK